MADLTNDFSWSRTREDKFRSCLRMYYDHYYGSWGGWKRQAARTTTEIYVMKNLKTRPMWVGEVVHDIARMVIASLRFGQPLSVEHALRLLGQRMESDWEVSLTGRFRQRPNKMLGLADHYYGVSLGGAEFMADYEHASNCVRNLYQTVAYKALAGDPSISLVEAEQLRSIEVSGVKVWLKIDLAIQSAASRIEIVDWKTGSYSSREETELQLAIYALYAARKWPIPIDHITTREVRLATRQEDKHRMDAGLLGWAEDYIGTSAGQMRALLKDPVRNVAVKESFPMTANFQRCRLCNFRRACGRESI